MFKIALRVALAIAIIMAGKAAYRHFVSSPRSTSAFCAAFAAGDQRIHNSVNEALTQSGQSPFGPLGGLAAIASTPAEFAQLFRQLDVVAPLEIEPSVNTIATSLAAEAKSLGDPLAAFATGLGSTIAWQDVTNFTLANCTPPPGGW